MHPVSRASRVTRPSLTLLLSALALLLLLLATVPAARADHRAGHERFLLVADTAAETLLVYRTSDQRLTGRLDDVVLGAHAGAIVLSDGRVVFTDDKHGRVLQVRITRRGRPRIVGATKIPGDEWDGAAWAAVDHNQRFYAVTADDSATVVDLETHEATRLAVQREPEPDGSLSELHPYLAGDPLQLVLTTGGKFAAYDLGDVLDDGQAAPTSTAPLAPGPHGPVLARDGSRVYATNNDGLGSAALDGSQLTAPEQVSYSDDVEVVRSSRPRLSVDGRTIIGAAPTAVTPALAPEAWAQTQNVVSTFDLRRGTSSLFPLANGIVGRSAISERYALFYAIRPEGDAAFLFDVDPWSPTYRTITHKIPLPPLTRGPVPGKAPAGTERRFGTLTPAGDRTYLTQGGDRAILVIDTATGTIRSKIRTPTPLNGGGYLVTVRKGDRLSDHHAR